MNVSVSIANWNRADLLRSCLESVFRTDPELGYEVIVVDNDSADDSVSMIRSMFPAVQLIRNSEPHQRILNNRFPPRYSSGGLWEHEKDPLSMCKCR